MHDNNRGTTVDGLVSFFVLFVGGDVGGSTSHGNQEISLPSSKAFLFRLADPFVTNEEVFAVSTFLGIVRLKPCSSMK